MKICLNSAFLNQTLNVKYLGFNLNWNLCLKPHCDVIAVKVSKGLGLIRGLRNELPLRVLMIPYHSIINLYLSYGCLLWTSSLVSSFKRVQSLQNKAVRVLGDYVRFQVEL